MLRELLAKMAEGEKLSPTEISHLRDYFQDVEDVVNKFNSFKDILTKNDIFFSTTNQIGCKLKRTTNQPVASATNVQISFNTVIYDDTTFSDLDNSPTRITIPTGISRGRYLAGFTVYIDANSTGHRDAGLFKNAGLDSVGIQVATGNAGATDPTILSTAGYIELIGGDYLQLSIFHRAGTTLNVQVAYAWLTKVG